MQAGHGYAMINLTWPGLATPVIIANALNMHLHDDLYVTTAGLTWHMPQTQDNRKRDKKHHYM